ISFAGNLYQKLGETALPRQSSSIGRRWLYKCARNFALNFQRHLTRERKHEVLWQEVPALSSPQHLPEAMLLQGQCHAMLRKALAQLTPAQSALFARRVDEGCSLEELALQAKTSLHAMEVRFLR